MVVMCVWCLLTAGVTCVLCSLCRLLFVVCCVLLFVVDGRCCVFGICWLLLLVANRLLLSAWCLLIGIA